LDLNKSVILFGFGVPYIGLTDNLMPPVGYLKIYYEYYI